MTDDPKAWRAITPEQLQPALNHIRESFGMGGWKCSTITKKLCYAQLHPEQIDSASVASYKIPFEAYRAIIGQKAAYRFDELLRIGSPPAIFRAYLDAYQEGLQIEIEIQFREIFQIGFANIPLLSASSVEWTKAHLKLLIRDEANRVQMWIREVCDKQDYSQVDPEDFGKLKESRFWSEWRAPKLIHLHPAGNVSYNPALAWAREDEQRTQQLLSNRSHRFLQFLEIHLDGVAGDAHVALAQHGGQSQPAGSKATSKVDAAVEAHHTPIDEGATSIESEHVPTKDFKSAGSRRGRPLLSNYRSGIKRAILIQLTINPGASDLEVCRGLDADGSVDPPTSWQAEKRDRSFVASYANRLSRRRVEIVISKVRTDLRKLGLLAPG